VHYRQKLATLLAHQGSDASRLSEEQYDKGELPADEMPTVVLGRAILDSVESHQHVEEVTSSTEIDYPKLIAYHSTKNDLFRNGYIIMERIPGQHLEDVLEDHSAEKPLILAKELGEIMNSLRQVTSSDGENIRASKSQNWPAHINAGQRLPDFSPDIVRCGLNSNHVSAGSNLPLRRCSPAHGLVESRSAPGDYPQDMQTGVEYRNLGSYGKGT
jgi:hypothetical protein